MTEGSESKPGVWASLKRILDTLLATAQSRVELFAVELQEEKCRLVEAILCAAAVAAYGMMTLYVDGHVQVYHGHAAQLPKHYVSRQCLCLRASTDYWINADDGQPFFVVHLIQHQTQPLP